MINEHIKAAFKAWHKSRSIEVITDGEIFNAGYQAGLAAQPQQESTINDEFLAEIEAKKSRRDAITDMAGRMAKDLAQAQQKDSIKHIVKNAILANSHPSEDWHLAFSDAGEIEIVADQIAAALPNEFGDPYQGAREDLVIWKKRALEAESKLRSQTQPIQKEPIQLPRSDTLMNILGRPNFACGGIANALRKKGHEIPTKAEHEQAEVLFWMTNLFLKCGEGWADEGEKYLNSGEQQ